ncbi:helix-turn-helix transcriptional regulator [Terrabacter sp. NPDC000476]|uniref:helix-turn-helix transcriptional regulator n=1 Tax=Terrabacter sp. NPDC000476 TaxID=3154258 RepID=UPI00332FC9EF
MVDGTARNTPGELSVAARRTLRTARAFMETNAAEAVSLDDIAAAAHVTVRSVQYAFADVGSTPLAYLRHVRMGRAHLDLVAGSVDRGDSVTEIAMAWRFGHQGRFAAAYRARYGLLPSATLARRA